MSSLFHDKDPRFGFGDGVKTWPDDFILVAEMGCDELDLIFEMTNHSETNWALNPTVQRLQSYNRFKLIQKTPRSTSPGDIVVDSNDDVYLCLPVGWKKIGTADKKITIPGNFAL